MEPVPTKDLTLWANLCVLRVAPNATVMVEAPLMKPVHPILMIPAPTESVPRNSLMSELTVRTPTPSLTSLNCCFKAGNGIIAGCSACGSYGINGTTSNIDVGGHSRSKIEKPPLLLAALPDEDRVCR